MKAWKIIFAILLFLSIPVVMGSSLLALGLVGVSGPNKASLLLEQFEKIKAFQISGLVLSLVSLPALLVAGIFTLCKGKYYELISSAIVLGISIWQLINKSSIRSLRKILIYV